MDHSKSGRAHLTDEQWAQRVAWAHRVWSLPALDPDWMLVDKCISRVRTQGHKAPLISAFTHPEMYPVFINAVFEKYVECRLLGETP